MKTHFKDICYPVREICKGSVNINLLYILRTTFGIYGVLLTTNKELFLSIIGFLDREDYRSIDIYIGVLENLHIKDITLAIPAIVTAILFIAPSQYIKSNIQNRLLPTEPWIRITALLLTALFFTMISGLMVYLFDQGVIYYVRQRFLPELIALRESMGDLYRQLPSDSILSQDYRYPISAKDIALLFLFSSMGSLLLLNLSLIFRQLNKMKGPLLIAAIVGAGMLLRELIQPKTATIINVAINRPPSILLIIILISMVFSLYYLLKEREE